MTRLDERPLDLGPRGRGQSRGWTFLTNHAHVLICIATDPDLRLRDVASRVGITERAAQRILHDLIGAGYVTRLKMGRRNSYHLRLEQPMRHPIEETHAVRDLIVALTEPADSRGITRRSGPRAT
jgi:predicted transcriptional regulator